MVLKLKKVQGQTELPFLVLYVDQFGTDARMRQYDMSAVTYIKKITLKCLEFSGKTCNSLWFPTHAEAMLMHTFQ